MLAQHTLGPAVSAQKRLFRLPWAAKLSPGHAEEGTSKETGVEFSGKSVKGCQLRKDMLGKGVQNVPAKLSMFSLCIAFGGKLHRKLSMD